jgi:hypothetical protein
MAIAKPGLHSSWLCSRLKGSAYVIQLHLRCRLPAESRDDDVDSEQSSSAIGAPGYSAGLQNGSGACVPFAAFGGRRERLDYDHFCCCDDRFLL